MPCPALWVAAATAIIISGRPYDVGRPVVLWCDEDRGFDAYAETCVEPSSAGQSVCCERRFKRYGKRDGVRAGALEDLQGAVSQLVLHHDGCVNSRSCFRSMHDMPRPDGGCGLSAHFMVDADGTIYQTLDVEERALHAGPANQLSVGVEMCNRGDAGRDELDRLPADYRTRPVRTVVINEEAHEAFDFRPEQYASMQALARVLLRTLPRIRAATPEAVTTPGATLLATLADPLRFSGIVGHFHVDAEQRKWDPGAFDFQALLAPLRGVYLPTRRQGQPDRLPDDDAGLRAAARAAADDSEGEAGVYPLGPGGLWDPGIYPRVAAGAAVRAVARGRVVAARAAGPDGRGFVLVRHRIEPQGRAPAFEFFTRTSGAGFVPLLAEARAGATNATSTWHAGLLARNDHGALARLVSGRTVLLDEPVEAGDALGAPQPRSGRVRVELFTAAELPKALAGVFRGFDGTGQGVACARAGVYQALGVPGPGALDRAALARFATTGAAEDRQLLRRLAVRLRHPQGDRVRAEAFSAAPALGGLTPDERARLFAGAVAPARFLDDALARHVRLPRSQVVTFHHPILFLASAAAWQAGRTLRWPSAELGEGFVATTTNGGRAALAWLQPPTGVGPAGSPLRLGPIVRPGFEARLAPRVRSEIPLVALPALEAR